MTALVVSEEAEVAERIQTVFEEAGHICFTTGTVEEAEGVLLSVVVDTIVLDIGGGSPRLVEWLDEVSRTQPELARCTIVVTGRPLEQEELSRIAAYGADTMWRPFLLRHLEDSVLLSRVATRRSARNPGSLREAVQPPNRRRRRGPEQDAWGEEEK